MIPEISFTELPTLLARPSPFWLYAYGRHCHYCQELTPVITQLWHDGLLGEFWAVDLQDQPQWALRYGVSGLPALLQFNKGRLQHALIGQDIRAQNIQAIIRGNEL